MNLTHYYIEVAGGGLQPALPARIVCHDEGNGEWTIDAEDSLGRCIRDEHGHYPASVWHDEEALDDFRPWTRDEAIAAAVALAAEIGLPTLPVFVWGNAGPVLVKGGAA